MNMPALIAALVGVTSMSFTVHFGNKITNRWLRYLAAAVGLLGSFIIMSYVPAVFGDTTSSTASLAGSYLGVLIVIAVIIKFIFFRKKKTESA